MDTIFPDYEEQQPKRSTFLTVLCILTFLWSAYSIVSDIITLSNPEKAAAAMRAGTAEMRKDTTGSEKAKAITHSFTSAMEAASASKKISQMSMGNIAATLLCFGGALLMWFRKRVGFWSYLAGTITGIALPLAIFGNNLFGIIGGVVTGFIGIIFCIMYAVNLKQMR